MSRIGPGLAKARPRLTPAATLTEARYLVRLPPWRGVSEAVHRTSLLDDACDFARSVGGSVFDTITWCVVAVSP